MTYATRCTTVRVDAGRRSFSRFTLRSGGLPTTAKACRCRLPWATGARLSVALLDSKRPDPVGGQVDKAKVEGGRAQDFRDLESFYDDDHETDPDDASPRAGRLR